MCQTNVLLSMVNTIYYHFIPMFRKHKILTFYNMFVLLENFYNCTNFDLIKFYVLHFDPEAHLYFISFICNFVIFDYFSSSSPSQLMICWLIRLLALDSIITFLYIFPIPCIYELNYSTVPRSTLAILLYTHQRIYTWCTCLARQ